MLTDRNFMELTDWQRIEKIVRWTGLSVNSFALGIGLPRGENLYQIKRGNNGISKELAEQISARYPEVSRAWILTGQGEMLLGDGRRSAIPCYDTDLLHLAAQGKLPEPSHAVSLPRINVASFAGLIMNRSMEPDIPQGATVIVQEIGQQQMVPGYPYVVVTANIAVIRIVRKEPEEDKIRLVAANPDFDDMVVDICELRRLYRVKGHIYYNQ